MSVARDQLAAVSVVTVGQFNPSIAHPSWLAAQGLITSAVAESAAVDVVHPDLAAFALSMSEGALIRIQVLRERLHLSTEDARLYETTRDLCIGILTLLRHTPVTRLGINYDCHVALASEDARNALGQRIAPPAPWAGIVQKAALLSLSMKSPRTDAHMGHVVVKVEPSVRYPFGVFIAVNDHFDLLPTAGTDKVVEILKLDWDASIKRSRQIVTKVIE